MAAPRSQMTSPPASITGILQRLASRPHVQSTLILSRKDGGIINATGALSTTARTLVDRQRPPDISAPPPSSPPGSLPVQVAEDGGRIDGPADAAQISPVAESLARCVMDFVTAAESLGSSLGESHGGEEDERMSGEQSPQGLEAQARTGAADEDTEASKRDGEIQLLRMRTRRHEIIIYPDARFLCCVVQATGKYGHG